MLRRYTRSVKHFNRFAALAALSAVAFGAAHAQEIGPGSPPPPMSVKTWFKGNAVDKLEPNKTYVVEFWATWCGPCRVSIPHITDLAKKNPDVQFVGVSIWEDDKDGNIAKFIGEMGPKMEYNVGYSGNKDGMAQTWMNAAGQNGIPTAFIVKNGIIQWIGHPMEMDKPLEEVKAGTFDLQAFKVKFDKAAAESRKQMAFQKALREILTSYDAGKTAEAKESLGRLVKDNPQMAETADSIRFAWMAKENPAEWEKQAKALASSRDEEKTQRLLGYAAQQVGKPGGDLKRARKAIDMAVKAKRGKDRTVLDYAAYVYTQLKEYKLALKMVNQNLALIPASPNEEQAAWKTRLEEQKKQLEAKIKG